MMRHDDSLPPTRQLPARRTRVRLPLIFLLAGTLACGGEERPAPAAADAPPASPSAAPAAPGETDDHAHVHAAPHGGILVELGEEFAHVELVLDPATGRLTAYALDGEAEGAIPLTQRELRVVIATIDGRATTVEAVLQGQANALSGETVERTSVFAADVPELANAATIAGRIVAVEVRGERFESLEFAGSPPGRGGD